MNLITWFLISFVFIGLGVYTSQASEWNLFTAVFMILALVSGIMALSAWRTGSDD